MTPEEWAGIAAYVQASWPQRELTDETLAAWYDAVEDLPAELALAAARSLQRTGREFAPTGGQIRARALELRGEPGMDHGRAWQLLTDAVRRFGAARETEALAWIREQDPVAAIAVRRLGFRDYCLSAVSEQSTWRAQFREIFKLVAGRAEAGVPLALLEKPARSELVKGPLRALTEGGEDG